MLRAITLLMDHYGCGPDEARTVLAQWAESVMSKQSEAARWPLDDAIPRTWLGAHDDDPGHVER